MVGLKKIVVLTILLGSITFAGEFEQVGVKKGENRISITGDLDFPKDDDNSIQFLVQYGKFITEDIEAVADVFMRNKSGNTTYLLGSGINYYVFTTNLIRPYIGAEVYYSDYVTDDNNEDYSSKGMSLHLGAHKFLTENFAITVDAGSRFIDFSKYKASYSKLYLSYFF